MRREEFQRRRKEEEAEEERLRAAKAGGREKVGAALTPLAEEGYFAFDLLHTDEAGAIDQLVVGPNAVSIVVVMPEMGFVWEEWRTGRLFLGYKKRTDPATGEVVWYGDPFEQDPYEPINAMLDEVPRKVYGGEGLPLLPGRGAGA